jgi:asparagine synthetase B (glutamine-hydrolysing)
MVESIDQAEVPLVHLQSILLYMTYRDGLKPTDEIVLNGQGADALFGLTTMYRYHSKKYLVHRELAPLLWLASAIVPESFFPFGRYYQWSLRKWNLDFAHPANALWMMGEVGDRAWVQTYFGVDNADIVKRRLEAISRFSVDKVLDAFSILDIVSDVGMTQDIWGQLAASQGKMNYYPYNSPGLIRALVRVPWEEKLAIPKQLMRTLCERLNIPKFIISRMKINFGIPSKYWAGPGGLAEPLLDVVAPVVDVELVRRFQGDDEKRAMIYWNWLNYGLWKRMIVNDEPRERLSAELEEAIQRRARSHGTNK